MVHGWKPLGRILVFSLPYYLAKTFPWLQCVHATSLMMVIATKCNIFMAMRNTLHVKFEFDLFRCGEAPRQEVIRLFLKMCKLLTFRRGIISTSDLYTTSCFLQSKSQLPIKYSIKCFVLPMLQCPIPRDTVRTVQFISCNEPCCSQGQTPYSEPKTKAKALATCRHQNGVLLARMDTKQEPDLWLWCQ